MEVHPIGEGSRKTAGASHLGAVSTHTHYWCSRHCTKNSISGRPSDRSVISTYFDLSICRNPAPGANFEQTHNPLMSWV
jgi:hypothetical protein